MNTDKSKTRTELLNELKESRQRLVQAEAVEKGLKREVEKYAHLASFPEANPNPVLELDPKGTIKYMNPATIHLFPNLATLGTKHPFLADWAQVVKELQSSNWGKSIVRGVVVEGLVYEQLVSVVTENQIRMYGRNVTELKDAEKASKESEERFRLASQIASDVVYERDLQIGIATFYGDIDCHLGYEPGEFPRTMEGWREHVHPEDLARIDRQGCDQL
jgi:PAS domain-containing protein